MAITLALWALYEFAGAPAWQVELLRYLPYPIYLAPPALALLASLALGWRWRAAAGLALALVVVDVMGLAWGRGDDGSGRLRVMTWNAKAFGLHVPGQHTRIAAEIAAHDPDVLVLQDANAYGNDAIPLPAAVRSALGQRTLFRHGQYVVASRMPMRDCRAVDLTVGGGEARDYVRCTIAAHGIDLDLVVTHLVSPREGLNAARREGLDGLQEWRDNYRRRLGQADKLVHDLARPPRPLVIAGDLNAAEVSPVIRTLKAIGLRDAFSAAGSGYGYTLGHSLRTGFSFLRIDHILVAPTIGVADCFVGGRDASQHRPVIADLWVRRS